MVRVAAKPLAIASRIYGTSALAIIEISAGMCDMQPDQDVGHVNYISKIKKLVFGAPKQIKDPQIFHTMSLIPLLAWVGVNRL